mmetsp:Transcript_102642/g.299423  ORF Transcript_102642/g.299423 Transcript_102642/m.299423 type:complete len:368 (+) Transcript_102642:72-1175(+)
MDHALPDAAPGRAPWESRFDRLEVWVLNTEYRLFGPDGPAVTPDATHQHRLDEMAKCLGVAPAYGALRLFWADAVISVEGPDLGSWMYWMGQRAPSEQQLVRFLWPNIQAACRGDLRTRTVGEAKAAWWLAQDPANEAQLSGWDGQPTPGIFVWRNREDEGEDWEHGVEWGDAGRRAWPTRPTSEHMQHFLGRLRSNPYSHISSWAEPSEAAVGLLLDIDGVDLRFLSSSPLSRPPASGGPEPKAFVAVLGGPKGVSPPFKELVRTAFASHGTPLLEASLGPREQMAHACVAFLRLQEDAGLLRAAAVDLLRLGRGGYAKLLGRVETALAKGSAAKGGSARAPRGRGRGLKVRLKRFLAKRRKDAKS